MVLVYQVQITGYQVQSTGSGYVRHSVVIPAVQEAVYHLSVRDSPAVYRHGTK